MKFTKIPKTALATMGYLATTSNGFAFVAPTVTRGGVAAMGNGGSSSRLMLQQQQALVTHPFSTTSSRLSMKASTSPTDFAKTEIANNKVVVFSKSYCPFCTATKTLLNEMKVDYTLHELNEMDNGSDIQSALLDMTGQRTVPNVFVNGKHLGGNDATQAAYKSGKLQKMLAGK
jgi:glutaredoxin 3